MRYVGQGHEITVALPDRRLTAADLAGLRETFEKEYSALFQRPIPGAAIEVLSWSVLATTEPRNPSRVAEKTRSRPEPPAAARSSTAARGRHRRAALSARAHGGGRARRGPAVIAEDETSTFVTASFDARIDGAGCIVMERRAA